MNSFLYHIKRFDWILIMSAVLLFGFGMLSLYSSSVGDFSNFNKQIIFFITALFFMFLFSFFDWRTLREDPYLILLFYFISCLALLSLFLFAPTIRGIKSWYKLGPFSLDPSELVKLVLIILLAKYFSMRHIEMYRIFHIFISGFYVLIPIILIFFQPNLGSVLILIALWLGILIISGIETRHFFILILCFLLIFLFSWSNVLKDYQKIRITTFFLPQSEPLGAGWNQAQAQIAVGSGGIWGKGFLMGSQTQYGFLPEPQTDFVFAAVAEEFGLIGVSVILLLFLILIWRIIKIAINSQSNFPRLFASGFAIVLISQVFINIGMNIGILPVVGIPLPLLSYGGSNLIMTFIAIGILQNMKTY